MWNEEREVFDFESIQINHIVHAIKLIIQAILIIDLAKWHKRNHIPVLFVYLSY
jgi:hypothetical protein